jgi:hypothetical protein
MIARKTVGMVVVQDGPDASPTGASEAVTRVGVSDPAADMIRAMVATGEDGFTAVVKAIQEGFTVSSDAVREWVTPHWNESLGSYKRERHVLNLLYSMSQVGVPLHADDVAQDVALALAEDAKREPRKKNCGECNIAGWLRHIAATPDPKHRGWTPMSNPDLAGQALTLMAPATLKGKLSLFGGAYGGYGLKGEFPALRGPDFSLHELDITGISPGFKPGKLNLSKCDRLTEVPPIACDGGIWIRECANLAKVSGLRGKDITLASLPNLTEVGTMTPSGSCGGALTVDSCERLTRFPDILRSPVADVPFATVTIKGCRDLRDIPEGLETVATIHIESCPSVTELPRGMRTKDLMLAGLDGLVSLPPDLQVETLKVFGCDRWDGVVPAAVEKVVTNEHPYPGIDADAYRKLRSGDAEPAPPCPC